MRASDSPVVRAVALLCAGLIGVSSCAVTTPSRPLTPEEQRMRAQAADFNRTIAEGVVFGALLGAMAGAATGAAVKSKNRGEGAAIGAAIGALAGGVLGGAAGSYYADKKQQYANEEQRLNSIIADLRQQNTELAKLVDSTRIVVAADQQRLNQIDQDLASKRISRQQAQRQLAAVDENIRFLQQTVSTLRERRADWQAVADNARADTASGRVQQMDQEIDRLEQQIRLMESELNALTSRRASVVG